MVGRSKPAKQNPQSVKNSVDSELVNLRAKNVDIIRENVRLKSQNAELKNELNFERQEKLILKTQMRQIIGGIQTMYEALQQLMQKNTIETLCRMGEIINTMIRNVNVNEAAVETKSDINESMNGSRNNTSPSKTKSMTVMPMISGHTIQNPTVNLQRVSLTNLQNQSERNESTRENSQESTQDSQGNISDESENGDEAQNLTESEERSPEQNSTSGQNYELHTVQEQENEDVSAKDYLHQSNSPSTSQKSLLSGFFFNEVRVYVSPIHNIDGRNLVTVRKRSKPTQSPKKKQGGDSTNRSSSTEESADSSVNGTTDSDSSEEQPATRNDVSQIEMLNAVDLTPVLSPSKTSTPMSSNKTRNSCRSDVRNSDSSLRTVNTRRANQVKRNTQTFQSKLDGDHSVVNKENSNQSSGKVQRQRGRPKNSVMGQVLNSFSIIDEGLPSISQSLSPITKELRPRRSHSSPSSTMSSQRSSFTLIPSPKGVRTKRSASKITYAEPSLRKKLRRS